MALMSLVVPVRICLSFVLIDKTFAVYLSNQAAQLQREETQQTSTCHCGFLKLGVQQDQVSSVPSLGLRCSGRESLRV